MIKKKLVEFIGKTETFGKKNSPAILTGLAIVGLIATAVSAYKAGSKAEKVIAKKKKDMNDVQEGDRSAKRAVIKETVKELTPIMLPPVIMGASTIGCMVGAQSISNRRIAALSAVYTLSESTVKDLNSKIVEIAGEAKSQKIRDAIAKDKLDKSDLPTNNTYIMSGDNTVLCKDSFSGRFFYSNADKINKAINALSSMVISEMYVSLNDFYEELNNPGLENVPIGDDVGWGVDDLSKNGLPIHISALLTDDNRPCLCIEYDVHIRPDFRSLH